ncbi:MAG: mismatch-specific DNA-glycosylase [Acidimicrobiales bacterium]
MRADTSLPLELAHLHHATPVDAVVGIEIEQDRADRRHLDLAIEGAGFSLVHVTGGSPWRLTLRRHRTLPDTVGPDLRLLVCGLNPSLHAADAGVGYAGPGNRFWPAALAAGITTHDRDPLRACTDDAMGMTDLVKRATPRAAELSAAEYRHGVDRIERLCAWLRPRVLCVVGLAGWRAAVDRRATAGHQPARLADTAVWLMPSTSGLNAATPLAALVEHLREAARLADDLG